MTITSDKSMFVGRTQGSTRAANDESANHLTRTALHAIRVALEDVVLLVLVVGLVPIAILLLGLPVALIVKLFMTIAERI